MYSAGLRNKRITVHNPGQTIDTDYGRTTQAGESFERWAAVDWTRGTAAMREGALDAYAIIMVRMAYTPNVTRDSKIEYEGRMFRVDSCYPDKAKNTIQLTCSELQNGQETPSENSEG